MIKVDGEETLINVSDIVYLEAQLSYCANHLMKDNEMSRMINDKLLRQS